LKGYKKENYIYKFISQDLNTKAKTLQYKNLKMEDSRLYKKEISKYVSSREREIEDLLLGIFEALSVPNNASAAELAKIWKEEVKKKVSALSVTLSHKVTPLIQILLDMKMNHLMNQDFVRIVAREPDMLTLIEHYNILFSSWFELMDDHVSYRALNPDLLGKLSAKDMFVLTYFVFLTNHRSKGDKVLQLGICGPSSCGKSSIFENPLLEGAHVTTITEKGVGRFDVGDKPVLLLQDINIRYLVEGKDADNFKKIARTETTVTKVFGSVNTLPNLFVFYSSNQRLLDHEFPTNPNYKWKNYPSQVREAVYKPIQKEHLEAVQFRYIEAFVRSKPPLNPKYMPEGGFSRLHAIMGSIPSVCLILQDRKKEDFHSEKFLQYVLGGLCRHTRAYNRIKNVDTTEYVVKLVNDLLAPEIRQDTLDLL